jgi:hypothetical protein
MDLELWIEDSRGSQGMRGRKCKITDNKTGNEGYHKEAGNSAQNYRPCFRENQPKRSFSIK